jgi:hypothetical protein
VWCMEDDIESANKLKNAYCPYWFVTNCYHP